MKKIVVMASLLLAGFNLFAQQQQKEDAATFAKEIQQPGVQVFDVRTAGEYNSGHLANALQADYNRQDEFLERVKYLNKEKPVYVYCLGGGRSAKAVDWMRKNGFTNVVELEGGINAWKQAGLPVEGVGVAKAQLSMEAYKNSIMKGWVLTDVGAAWCPPCRQMEPVLASLLAKHKNLKLVKVDGGNDTEVMKQISALKLPTFIMYKDGVEKGRITGVVSQETLEAMMK